MKPCYNRWYNIMRRCYDIRNHDYKHYGRRGITVCREWHTFSIFKEWFNEKTKDIDTTDGMDVDRIDPHKGYSPSNCQVITHKENVKRSIRRDALGRFRKRDRRCA